MLYVSGAARPISAGDIDDILAASRRNNAARDITGMLLSGGDAFIQVLEGERGAVGELAARIRRDPRHRNFMVLVEREAETRAFADWQMGFKALDPERAADASVFQMSRLALEKRIGKADGGMTMDLVLAFAGKDFMAKAG